MTESKSLETAQRVAHALTTLAESDGALFLCCGESFARVRRLADGGLRFELPTNELTPPERWIDARGVDLLREAGYALPKSDERFFARTIDLESGAELAEVQALARLLTEVYDAPRSAELRHFTSTSGCERPSAARAANAIQRYRESPSPNGWDELCAALLLAELELAVEPALGPSAGPPRVRALQGPEGRLAAAAFTSTSALRLAAPRGLPFAVLRGADALRLVAAQGFEALAIDPRGPLPVLLHGAIFRGLVEGATSAALSANEFAEPET
ncbi:MAG: SseB family protein [Planctomycetes bacterium]|nr:SseB family protein [Planctomycetota bacterium]